MNMFLFVVASVCVLVNGTQAQAHQGRLRGAGLAVPSVTNVNSVYQPAEGELVYENTGSATNLYLNRGSTSSPIWVSLIPAASVAVPRGAHVANTGSACNATTVGGSWVTATSWNGTGDCTLAYAGQFSSQPVCTCSSRTGSHASVCQVITFPNSSAVEIKTHTLAGAGVDDDFELTCIGEP